MGPRSTNYLPWSSMRYVLRFEHVHGPKRYNDKDDSWSNDLDSFYLISFLQFLFCFPENDCSFDRLLTLLKESGRHSKSSVKAVAIFLFRAIKSTLITLPFNENIPRFLLQQLRCYLSP